VLTSAGAVLALAPASPRHAAAQDYPSRPIDLVDAFPPGGSSDISARALSEKLQETWDQPVNVVNREGASGATGAMSVKTAEPDGYTILMSVTSAGVTNPAVQGDALPYTWDDFTFISRVNTSPLVAIVSVESPYETLQELADALKADPSAFSYGTSGVGGPSTFATAQIAAQAGIDPNALTQVVLGGGAPTVTAVAGGNVDFAVQNLSEVIELIKGEKLRGLAVSNPERVEALPDVPTAEEAGFDQFTFQGWNGLVGPLGLDPAVVDAWNEAVEPILADPEFQSRMRALGLEPAYLGPEEFKQFLQEQYDFAKQVAEEQNLGQG
jgi:tripartite-type tricarboxylate transporter receptor subunit TctC